MPVNTCRPCQLIFFTFESLFFKIILFFFKFLFLLKSKLFEVFRVLYSQFHLLTSQHESFKKENEATCKFTCFCFGGTWRCNKLRYKLFSMWMCVVSLCKGGRETIYCLVRVFARVRWVLTNVFHKNLKSTKFGLRQNTLAANSPIKRDFFNQHKWIKH